MTMASCKGIAWLLDRGRVAAIDVAGADIVMEQGSKQRFYRNGIKSMGAKNE